MIDKTKNNKIKLGVLGRRIGLFGKLLQSKVFYQPYPLLVTFAITGRCNFNCHYCYGDYCHREKTDIATKDILNLLRLLAKNGTRFLQLSGGEPLLHQDIEKIVDEANRLGLCLGISTNGSLLEEKLAVVKKIGTVAISFDGPEKANDLNRGKGTFKKALKAIDVALKAGVNVHTYTTVTRNNLDSLDYVLEFAKKRKIQTEFGFPVVRALKADKEYKGLDLSVEQFQSAVKKLIAYKKKGYPILFSQKVMEKVLKWPDYSKKIWQGKTPSFDHIKCFAPEKMVFIDADAKVYPCIQFIGLLKALDFRRSGFKKALEKAHQHHCQACYLMCVNDFNLLFNFDLAAIWNNVKISLLEMK